MNYLMAVVMATRAAAAVEQQAEMMRDEWMASSYRVHAHRVRMEQRERAEAPCQIEPGWDVT